MPIQPVAGQPLSVAQLASLAFPPPEWQLLAGLPGRIISAAAGLAPAGPPGAVAAGLAGLDALAGGRAFDSDLVRAVVGEIYAAAEGEPGCSAPPPRRSDPAGRVRLLAECRRAADVLALRADPADSAAYRQWLQSIAARVCAGSDLTTRAAERRFLDQLATALRLR